MSFSAKIILDSTNCCTGTRLITSELTYPRFIHAEFMTHRVFSRNAASSRAIPTRKMIEMVKENPAMPVYWGKNRRGMSAGEEITDIAASKELWLEARDRAVEIAEKMRDLKMHKQIVNRILEPWKWMTVIVTATQFSNFFALRDHADAQPEIAHIARMWKVAMDESKSEFREWHIPYIQDDEQDLPLDTRLKISTARCARVSYLTHDGVRSIHKDLELHQRLLTGGDTGHWSPFEHPARAIITPDGVNQYSGNFLNWEQYRKMHKGECQ
jgi:thymidylate synthase ThyX